jgi:hypothetical protein
MEELTVNVATSEAHDRKTARADHGMNSLQVDGRDHSRTRMANPAFRRDGRIREHLVGNLLSAAQFGQLAGNALALLLEPGKGLFRHHEPVCLVLEVGSESGPQFLLETAALAEDEDHANTVRDQFADFAQDGEGDGRVFNGLAFHLDHEDPPGEFLVV